MFMKAMVDEYIKQPLASQTETEGVDPLRKSEGRVGQRRNSN